MASADDRPAGARVTTDMIGSTSGPHQVTWSERDTMLYALGVGAGLGAPETELGFTTENSACSALRALPSFLTVIAIGQKPPALDMLDVGRFLHAEQRIELVRALPASGKAVLTTSIESVCDKGTGAIVATVATLSADMAGQDVIGRARMGIFVRGGGGFAGPRGTADRYDRPARAPDLRIVHETRPEQALLYRLSGDRHPLHSDPAFARDRGFERPILHGLCTYGFACRALVAGAAGGDPNRLRKLEGRFRKPVYPGDTLTTEIWADGSAMLFRTMDSAGDAVIERGRAAIAG